MKERIRRAIAEAWNAAAGLDPEQTIEFFDKLRGEITSEVAKLEEQEERAAIEQEQEYPWEQNGGYDR